MATGTGKTVVAFQICWKLWSSRWNRTGEHRRPRILYLADRNILVDDPMAKTFAPFGDARWKIENGDAVKSREMYFAIYQSIASDANRPGLYREYAAGLLRPDHRRRMPSRQRPRRQQLAGDSRLLRAGLSARHDRHAAPAGQRRHLQLFRRSDLHVQPAAGNRRRLPRSVPRPSRRHDLGRRRLATEPGRPGSLRPRDSRRGIPHQRFRADCFAARPEPKPLPGT